MPSRRCQEGWFALKLGCLEADDLVRLGSGWKPSPLHPHVKRGIPRSSTAQAVKVEDVHGLFTVRKALRRTSLPPLINTQEVEFSQCLQG